MLEKRVEKRIVSLVAEKIADRPDLFLVEVKMLPNRKLIILVDGDQGIGIAECAQISRHVGFHLEEENAIEQAYNLEVSSPGIDTPLKLRRQYLKNVGRDLSIKLIDSSFKQGNLTAVDEENLVIEEKIKAGEKSKKVELVQTTIPLTQVAEAKVVISFK